MVVLTRYMFGKKCLNGGHTVPIIELFAADAVHAACQPLLLGLLATPIILRRCVHDSPGTVTRTNLIQIVGQPLLQFVKYIMLRRGIDPFMPQCLLCFANIAIGELRPDKAPEIMGLKVAQPHLVGIPLHRTPHVTVDSGAALARCPRPPKLVNSYSLTTGRRTIHCINSR